VRSRGSAEASPKRSFLTSTLVFASGFGIGLMIVVYPTLGPLLTDRDMFGLTNAQYGLLFLPQIVAAIVSALAVRRLGARIGMKRVVIIGTGCCVVAMALLLVASSLVGHPGLAYSVLLVGTAAVGAGFAATMSGLNVYAFELFREHPGAAITGLHMVITAGSVLSPLMFSLFLRGGYWPGAPMVVAAILAGLLVSQVKLDSLGSDRALGYELSAERVRLSQRVWLWAALALLYGACEATFAYWGPVYANEDKGLSVATSALALSAFWGALTLGRALFTAFSLRFRTRALYVVAPFVVAAAFLVLPLTQDTMPVILGFALGGLGCSFFYPNSVGLASNEQPMHAAVVSATMTAFLFVGFGLGSNLPGILRSAAGLSAIFTWSLGYAVVLGLLAIFMTSTRKERPRIRAVCDSSRVAE
jgi:fucose permease